MTRRLVGALVVGFGIVLGLASATGNAETYPAKAITFVVPFAAGTGVEAHAGGGTA